MERDDVYNNFWINEEELSFLKEWYDKKLKIIKKSMRDSGSLVYLDYSMTNLTGGLPTIYVAKPEDFYIGEDLVE